QLFGITSLLNRQLYHGGKYDGVPLAILKAAAERGSKVHMEVEMYFAAGFVPAMEEAKAIIEKFDRKEIIATEYLVSDEENFATAIDLVDSDFNLYDIKTTAVLDENYTSWQLSICAFLFEQQNKFSPNKLFAIHVRGDKAEIIEIERHSSEEVTELLACDLLGENYFDKKIAPALKEMPITQFVNLENLIIKIEEEAKKIKEMRDQLAEKIYSKMEEIDVKKFETDNMIITRILPSEVITIDTKKLKAEMPEIAEKFEKKTMRKGSLKITLK
ncbi:MAG TPA: hypothetical protein PLR11_01810, partial [Candidatus Paceibacterota bacterium]|nr:hypothetical protein [Candidatus Paceibacterota bacterium]